MRPVWLLVCAPMCACWTAVAQRAPSFSSVDGSSLHAVAKSDAVATLGAVASPDAVGRTAAPVSVTGVAGVVAASLSGNVTDESGAGIAGAVVTLTTRDVRGGYVARTEMDGGFRLANLAPGPYTLNVAAEGVRPWSGSGVLEAGRGVLLPEIALALKPVEAFVQVSATRTEIAQAQIELAEKQRVLGVFPNFYASYVWDAAPLTARQKYSMAWRLSVDPVTFASAALTAGAEQAGNGFRGYGFGVAGYGKRFGAAYGDDLTSTLLGQAILPALLHQDPRYFVKGTGTVRSRTLYALANTVMCRGDNGRWQVNYSNIVGNMASASLSNVYYPTSSRHGAGLTIENSLLSTASGAAGNLLQEFMLRHMTPHVPDYEAVR